MGAKTYVVRVIVREIRTENFGVLHHDGYLACVNAFLDGFAESLRVALVSCVIAAPIALVAYVVLS